MNTSNLLDQLLKAGQQAMRDGKAWRTVIDEEGKASPILAPRTQSSSSDAVAAETAPDQD